MAIKLKKKPEVKQITRRLAEYYSTMIPAANDRKLNERRLNRHQTTFNEGRLGPVTWASAFCNQTGLEYRVDGKHTSVMFSAMEKIPAGYYAKIEEYICDSLTDVSDLYARFDSRSVVRTAQELCASAAGAVTELRSRDMKTVSLITAGMALGKWGMNYANSTEPPQRTKLLHSPDNLPFILWCLDTVFTGVRKERYNHLHRAAVIGAMHNTWLKDRATAEEFWLKVRDETGLSPETPDRRLARFLLTTGVNFAHGAKRSNRATNHEFYSRCITAYNAYKRGDSTNLRYDPSKPPPTPI